MTTLNDFFKLASDDTRFRIMVLLMQRDLYVCQICGIMKLSQPKVSKHLTKLRNTKFVTTEQNGKYITYKLSIKDPRILSFMNSVLNNCEEYPIIKDDCEKLKFADLYLSCCEGSSEGECK